MKARKLLALLLAVLLTFSVVIVPTAADATSDATYKVFRFTSTMEDEQAYYDPSLLVGTESTVAPGSADWSGRFADRSNYFGYAFPINSAMPNGIEFRAQMRGDLLVQVSLDKSTWKTVRTATGMTPTWCEIDLTAAVRELMGSATTLSTLYLRFGDSDTSNGGGSNVMSSRAASLILDYTTGSSLEGYEHTHTFRATGVTEKQYLDANIGVGSVNPKNETLPDNYARYKDGEGYFGYAFPVKTSSDAPESIVFSAMMRGDLLVEVSTDKVNWEVAYTRPDSEAQNANLGWRNLDLTAAVAKVWGNTSPSYLYVRFGDLVKDGWGTHVLASRDATLKLTYSTDTTFYQKNAVDYTFTPTKNWSTESVHKNPTTNANSNDYCHFADTTNQTVYQFEMLSADQPTALTMSFKTSGQLRLSVSTDNVNWKDVYVYEGTATDTGLGSAVRTFDLLAAYQTAYTAYASNMLYVRIADSYESGGHGGTVYYDTPVSLHIEYGLVAQGLTMAKFESTINGTADDKYYVGGGNVSGTARYADRDAYVVMMYPVTGVGSSECVLLTMSATQQLLLQVSVDGTNWVTAFRYSDFGYLATQATADSQNAYLFPRKERTFDLTAAVKAADAASKAAGTSDSGLYIRWGDAHPVRVKADGTEMARTEEGFNAGAGWGGNVTGKVVLSLAQTAGLGAVADSSKVTLTQATPNANGSYMLTGQEPMLVTDAGVKTGGLSNAIHANHVEANGDGTYTLKGDGNYAGRFADNDNYFVYRYQIPAAANAMVWSAVLGGGYGVDLAIGGADCPNPMDASLWKNVALYSEDGLNGTTQTANKVITYDLSGIDVSSGDKYVYLKFYDADTAHGGYGPRIAFGSKYFVTMSWEVSLEEDIKSAGLAGVSFNLTDSINMRFYPTLPLSTTEVKAEIVYENDSPIELTAADDGTYMLEDIHPAELNVSFTFRLTGVAGEAAEFSYEKEINPKQVALDTIAAYPRNKALVTMLQDMLVYGAAFSVAAGGENWLADTDIVARDFERYMIGGSYSELTYGEKTGDATFVDCGLLSSNATELRIAFTATDVTDLKIRALSNTGSVVYYDASDFIAAGQDNEYYLSISVNTYDFSKIQMLCFVENGEVLDEYYMPASVNNTIANILDWSGDVLSDAIKAMLVGTYQFGESVNNYAESTVK